MANITIAGMTSKATPIAGDLLEIADSAAANAAKKVTAGSLPVSAATQAALDAKAAAAHAHSGADLTSGTVAIARLGSGPASATTFLRGDQSWATPPGGGATTLDGLTDVVIAAPARRHALGHDGTTFINLAERAFDPRLYGTCVGDGATDCTAAIQAAIDAAAATVMAGMKFQSAGGGYQAGATAPGGGTVALPAGVFVASNLVLKQRVALVGYGCGTVISQKAASTGPLVTNRRDGTAHAGYCQVRDLTLHGNADNQTAANHGVLWQGDETFTYTSPLDEDWDPHCLIQNVQIIRCKGSGIRTVGSGEHQTRGVFARSCDGIGIDATGYDSWFTDVSVAHSGLQGFLVAGDSNRLANVKVWYSGRLTPASGHGFHLTADTGEMVGCNAQDNKACGFSFDGANRWSGAGLNADNNDQSNGGYPGYDFWDSTNNLVAGAAGNRYNATPPAAGQTQDTALRVRQNSRDNLITLAPAGGVWGGVNPVSADSVIDGNTILLGGRETALRTVTAAATLGWLDRTILVNATAPITLPTAIGKGGWEYRIKRIAVADGASIVAATGQTIDGAASVVLTGRYDAYTLVSDGAGWQIV